MIILDETKLTFETISLIGRDYGIEYDYKKFDEKEYQEFIQLIVDKFKVEE